MDNITNTKLQDLMEQFLSENPSGDSFELARFMYNHGWNDAEAANK